jgi:prephenate dehydrogenase
METVAIVGVGLIGASFGLALRKSGFSGVMMGVSSGPAIEAGLATGAITTAATLNQAAAEADLIYLAQPVDRILATLEKLGPLVRHETFLTDAGSTKAAIVQQASRHLPSACFVGGHPMAGKETRGAQSADADLFRGRPYVLTPDRNPVPPRFLDLLQAIGAQIVEMTPEQHDATVALTSHLPQLLSTALAAFLARQQNPDVPRVFGAGLLDMTRLGLSPSDLWSSILSTNKTNVLNALQSYIDILSEASRAVEAEDLGAIFHASAAFSRSLRKLDN